MFDNIALPYEAPVPFETIDMGIDNDELPTKKEIELEGIKEKNEKTMAD